MSVQNRTPCRRAAAGRKMFTPRDLLVDRPGRYYFGMVRWLLRQNAIDVLFVAIATGLLLLFVSTLL
jgi:hypothetical protein